ncbi:MAG: hypothetical protein IPJ09_13050 [Saprospiraceae bacterium]|nr:hypothetical protein [Saprospiraceae bacterium]
MSKDPEFAARTVAIKKRLTEEIEKGIFANGSSFGSPHYTQTGIDPIWFTLLQIKQAGLGNMFSQPLIKKYAVFLTSLLTPPSARFNLNRKLISFGDGSEESAGSFGLLATGLKDIDPALSRTLLSLYYNGPPTYIFAGPAPLAISSTYQPPATQITLTDCSYNGYVTHFRLGANHRLESALWVLNGDTFYDHRGDDRGEVAIYALGAPLSLSSSSFYMPMQQAPISDRWWYPRPGFRIGQEQISRSMMGSGGTAWGISKQVEFVSFNNAAYSLIEMSNSDSGTWTRKILEIHLNDSVPIYVFTIRYPRLRSGV